MTETYEELAKADVIDPVKVVRTALENAVSASAMLITTEAAVVERLRADGRRVYTLLIEKPK